MAKAWQPVELPPAPICRAGLDAIEVGLRELGMIKHGETISEIHMPACPTLRPPYPATCTCPGGPELVYADWNELQGALSYTPERFRV